MTGSADKFYERIEKLFLLWYVITTLGNAINICPQRFVIANILVCGVSIELYNSFKI